MSQSVSVIIPALDDYELLARNLKPLFAELERRSEDDEVIVVDDTGEDQLRPKLAVDFPKVRAVAREENGGFAKALRSGFEEARHTLCFSMLSLIHI